LVRARPFAEFQAVIDELLKQQPPSQSCFPTCKISASCPTLYVEANIWMNLVG
jgi:hypothetical protein